MSEREKLWHLFDRWDRKRDALVEYEKREGVTVPIDHGDESRPE